MENRSAHFEHCGIYPHQDSCAYGDPACPVMELEAWFNKPDKDFVVKEVNIYPQNAEGTSWAIRVGTTGNTRCVGGFLTLAEAIEYLYEDIKKEKTQCV